MSIDPIMQNLNQNAPGATLPDNAAGAGSVSFTDELKSKINQVNQLQNEADAAVRQSTIKGASDIHETMIKLEEADMGLRLLAKVRNKALDAYHEIMHMQF